MSETKRDDNEMCKCGHVAGDHDDEEADEFGLYGQCFECNCADFDPLGEGLYFEPPDDA